MYSQAQNTKKDIEKEVSYLIGYRESTLARKNGLQFVLNWIYQFLPALEVLIIEQDEVSRMSVDLPPNCKKIFAYNKGLFNRSWGFNVGLKHTRKNIIAFADGDLFMEKEAYLKCFFACLTFEAVTPKASTIDGVRIFSLEHLTYRRVGKRRAWTFAGGFLVMSRAGIEKIGNWCEEFEGWGYEDNAISYIIQQRLSTKIFNFLLIHINHERTVFDSGAQPKFNINFQLYQEIKCLTGSALDRYCELERNRNKGDINKYSLSNETKTVRPLKFMLAVLSISDLFALSRLLNSWSKFKSNENNWEVILSDEGLNEEEKLQLEKMTIYYPFITIFKNGNRGIAHAYNCMFRYILDKKIDLCFFVKPELIFKKRGWDTLYSAIINRTGIANLVFFDKRKVTHQQLGAFAQPKQVNESTYEFFTINRTLLKEVGYMDTQNLGYSILAIQDFFYRCSLAGFNDYERPMDAFKSHDYIELQHIPQLRIPNYKAPIIEKIMEISQVKKKNLYCSNKIFLPWNEVDLTFEEYIESMRLFYPRLKDFPTYSP